MHFEKLLNLDKAEIPFNFELLDYGLLNLHPVESKR